MKAGRPVDGIERAIARVAGRHGGHISRAQLFALGLSRNAVDHRVKRGLLIAVFDGVYAVGHLPTNPIDQAAGALLAVDPKSGMAHDSAATLWGVYQGWTYPLHVITEVDRRPRGIKVHRSTALRPIDFRIRQGLRVTSPQLTLLHIAPRLTEKRLTRAINELRFERQMNTRHLAEIVFRFRRHPGAKRLRLHAHTPKNPTRSQLEDDFQTFIATGDFPFHHLNHPILPYTVDVYFPRERLIVETDGWDTHGTFEAFQRDRGQDSDILAETGIPTVRLTHADVTKQAPATRRKLDKILANRRPDQAA